MNKQHPNYGLYGQKSILLPDFMHSETIESNARKHEWVIKPHFHSNLFQVFLFEKGEIKFWHDDEETHLSAPCIIAVPENISHGFEFSPDIDGKVLTISHSFVEQLFLHSSKVLLQLNQLQILTHIQDHKRFPFIKRVVYRLFEEMQEDLPEKNFALQSYFSLVLTEVYRFAVEKDQRRVEVNNKNIGYFRTFQRLMKERYNPQRQINEYARELGITTVHLNRVCRAVAAKSPLEIVHDFFVLEAEKHLKYTDFSVSEIAYRLNFEDPAYFSRLFKKQTGHSPLQFRKQILKP